MNLKALPMKSNLCILHTTLDSTVCTVLPRLDLFGSHPALYFLLVSWWLSYVDDTKQSCTAHWELLDESVRRNLLFSRTVWPFPTHRETCAGQHCTVKSFLLLHDISETITQRVLQCSKGIRRGERETERERWREF